MRSILSLIFAFFLFSTAGFAQPNLELPETGNDEIIIRHTGFTLSYNAQAMIPNWVAYDLEASDMEGDAVRAGHFSSDPSPLLEGLPLAEHWHFTNSGWVRGHMAPAGDLKYSQQAMNDSFYTTNVCPMDMGFNNGIWKRLEEWIRRLTYNYDRVYIVTGPVIGDNRYGKVGDSNILIPDAFFKAILVPTEDSYLSIGFLLFNEPAPKGSRLRDYALPVDDLESLIERDLFCNLNRKTAAIVEKQLPLKELGLY